MKFRQGWSSENAHILAQGWGAGGVACRLPQPLLTPLCPQACMASYSRPSSLQSLYLTIWDHRLI